MPFVRAKRTSWNTAADVLRGWKRRAGVESDRILILNQIWEREAGPYSLQWRLSGVRRGIIYVKVRSAAAAHELQLRGAPLVKRLNKHFKRSWIKSIRPTAR